MKFLKVFIVSLSLLFICNTMFGDGEAKDLVRSMNNIERTLSEMNKNLERIAKALEKQNSEKDFEKLRRKQ